jgi:hypothetical protein
MVRQWLCVNRPVAGEDKSGSGRGEVWARDVEMDFLPGKGDKITLWPDLGRAEDDLFGGETWPVIERMFSSDGRARIELVTMYVDPEDGSMRDIRALRSDSGRAFWTDDHGDPAEKLPRGGWIQR